LSLSPLTWIPFTTICPWDSIRHISDGPHPLDLLPDRPNTFDAKEKKARREIAKELIGGLDVFARRRKLSRVGLSSVGKKTEAKEEQGAQVAHPNEGESKNTKKKPVKKKPVEKTPVEKTLIVGYPRNLDVIIR
jgi:hypothetical protein